MRRIPEPELMDAPAQVTAYAEADSEEPNRLAGGMILRFSKLEGLGNDFVLVDQRTGEVEVDAVLARVLADRRTGVGCDQILVLTPPERDGSLLSYAIWNADGSIAEQCGNGARCIGLWLQRAGELTSAGAWLDSPAGPIQVKIAGAGLVQATLPPPDFSPPAIGEGLAGDGPWRLHADRDSPRFHGASMGNPHILFLSDTAPEPAALAALAETLAHDRRFPAGVNIGLAQRVDCQTLLLRVHERGAGPTPACGSGACAAACMLIRAGLLTAPATVIQPGGSLVIEWRQQAPTVMTGPARHVFSGEMEWNGTPT